MRESFSGVASLKLRDSWWVRPWIAPLNKQQRWGKAALHLQPRLPFLFLFSFVHKFSS